MRSDIELIEAWVTALEESADVAQSEEHAVYMERAAWIIRQLLGVVRVIADELRSEGMR